VEVGDVRRRVSAWLALLLGAGILSLPSTSNT
jgi:hypothetical protein